jgi:DNA-directed RNA polymerase specialized sigma24 family protein
VDIVAPQHELAHAWLEEWGRWSREKRARIRCGSAERQHRANWRSWHYPTFDEMMPALVNPRVRLTDRAVLRLPFEHRDCIVMFYVEQRQTTQICRVLVIHWRDFGKWMFDCRAMVVNILRELGAASESMARQSTGPR